MLRDRLGSDAPDSPLRRGGESEAEPPRSSSTDAPPRGHSSRPGTPRLDGPVYRASTLGVRWPTWSTRGATINPPIPTRCAISSRVIPASSSFTARRPPCVLVASRAISRSTLLALIALDIQSQDAPIRPAARATACPAVMKIETFLVALAQIAPELSEVAERAQDHDHIARARKTAPTWWLLPELTLSGSSLGLARDDVALYVNDPELAPPRRHARLAWLSHRLRRGGPHAHPRRRPPPSSRARQARAPEAVPPDPSTSGERAPSTFTPRSAMRAFNSPTSAR